MTMLATADEADTADWVQAHTALSRLARQRAAADAEEGRWMLRALRSAAHVHMACGSFAQYIERLFGYDRRTTQEKLRVAEALEGLPLLSGALEAGAINGSAVRELTRVAVPETQAAWLEAARGKTVREIEALVSSRRPGDLPDAPVNPLPRAHVLRFEVAPETYALFREAVQRLRRDAGGALDDDALLLSMARHVLGGPGDAGRAAYQVSLTVCAVCRSGQQLAGGELVPVGADIVGMVDCDAQNLGPGLPRVANENGNGGGGGSRTDISAPGGEAAETASVGGTAAGVGGIASTGSGATGACSARSEGSSDAHGRTSSHRAHVGAPAPEAHVGVRTPKAAPMPRATQTIPPALRRAVLLRDHGRCRVPGCTHSTFVDVHHLQPRAEGGANTARNIITLCSAHHRAVHRGQLSIQQAADGALTFWHADGVRYGHAVAPGAVDARAKVFSALRQLGFREREANLVLAELREDEALRDATVSALLGEALRRIRSVSGR